MKRPKVVNRLNLYRNELIKRDGGCQNKSNQFLNHLSNQLVEFPVAGPLHVEPVLTDVEHSVIIHQEGDISVLHGGVGGQDRVVGLHH